MYKAYIVMKNENQILKRVLILNSSEYSPPEGYEITSFRESMKDPDYVLVLLQKIKTNKNNNDKTT